MKQRLPRGNQLGVHGSSAAVGGMIKATIALRAAEAIAAS
jgi:hypothetical protein